MMCGATWKPETAGTNNYAYDAERQIKTLNSTAAAYTYDGDGQRVYKQAGGVTTEYVYLNGTGGPDRLFLGPYRRTRSRAERQRAI